jgi:RNA polymerase sigma-70 factor (ECF subfamily)
MTCVTERDELRERRVDRAPVAFPATRWTLVNRAGGADGRVQPVAIAELVRMYSPALRAHLLQTLHYDEHRADDLLQGFLAEKVLEQRLIGCADPARGRFRTFLLAALDRYVVDEHRHRAARKRSPRKEVLDVHDHRDTLAARGGPDGQTDAFDLAWAREVLGEVLATMRARCEQTDRLDLWDVFQSRYLKPAMEGVSPEPHDSIARRLNLDGPRAAANLLITAKRQFTRVFKEVVKRYAAGDAEARDEVAELWRIFAAGRG